jgi:signal recognition particle receptor subunit beta
MALFNYATKEITIKIVYYGPGLSGKTTNLQYLHSIFDPSKRGKLLSLATEADRTLFFDFLPIEVGKISDFSIRFQLYTVPGQVRYNATRKLVLKGADAVIFVADSQREMKEQNIDSLKNMHENLVANNIDPYEIPIIMQYNKRDIKNILSVDELNKDLNEEVKHEYREAIAIDGTGVEDTFKRITKLVIDGISKKHKVNLQPVEEAAEHAAKDALRKEIVHKPAPTKPEPVIPVIERLRYDEHPGTEIERSSHEMTEYKKEPLRSGIEEPTTSSVNSIVEQSIEIKETPGLYGEKLDNITNSITEISQTIRELKNIISSVHSEMKEIKRDQKELSSMLKTLTNTFENIKMKKSWFRFS